MFSLKMSKNLSKSHQDSRNLLQRTCYGLFRRYHAKTLETLKTLLKIGNIYIYLKRSSRIVVKKISRSVFKVNATSKIVFRIIGVHLSDSVLGKKYVDATVSLFVKLSAIGAGSLKGF